MKKLRFILALFSCSMLIAEGSLHAGATAVRLHILYPIIMRL